MGKKLDDIKVKHSNINEFWFYFIIFIIAIFLGNLLIQYTIYLFSPSISTIIQGLLWYNIGIIAFASLVFYWMLPLVRVRFLVSKECFRFDLQRKLFLKVSWRDLERLEVIKVKFNRYKINYTTLNQTKTLRLYLLQFSRKKTRIILKLLKTFAENVNVKFKEGKKEAVDKVSRWKDLKEINKLIRSVKKLS